MKQKLKRKWITAIMLSILLVVCYYSFIATGVHESPAQFGGWGQKILLEYSDGSLNPLGVYNPLFSVLHDGQEITKIHYILSARATGTGYTSLIIDISKYQVLFKTGATTPSNTYTLTFTQSSMPINIDGQWYQLVSLEIPIASIVGSLPNGDYVFTISPAGQITYSANGEPPLTATLPAIITDSLTVSAGATCSFADVFTYIPSVKTVSYTISSSELTKWTVINNYKNTLLAQGYVVVIYNGTSYLGNMTVMGTTYSYVAMIKNLDAVAIIAKTNGAGSCVLYTSGALWQYQAIINELAPYVT